MRKQISKCLCEKCGREIQKSNYKKHFNSCDGIKRERFKKLQECPYCHKDISEISGGNHVRWCILNPKGNEYRKRKTIWNKNKTKNDNEKIKQQSETLRQKYKDGKIKRIFKHEKRKPLSEEHKLKIKNKQKDRVLKGLHHGWKINSDINRRSYPEKWFIENVLEKFDLYSKYTIKEKFSFGRYFFDFAFIELKLDLEIDGGQHIATQEAINHDLKRDNFTKSMNWIVYRINWQNCKKNPNEEIKNFITFIGLVTQ